MKKNDTVEKKWKKWRLDSLTLRVETFARRKKREIFDINFRVWWFLGQISRKKLSRIEKKVHYGGKKLSRMARSKGKKIWYIFLNVIKLSSIQLIQTNLVSFQGPPTQSCFRHH